MWRFRLSDEDRKKYGGPEWVEFRLAKAVELDTDLLEAIEDATGFTILVTLSQGLDRGSHKAVRTAFWLARHIAGVHEPPFHEFKPKLLEADFERVVDVDPPAEPPNRAARRAVKATRKPTAPRSAS